MTLTTETLFVFDFKVQESFDYGPNERLINNHLDLIYYIIDAQDKDWFIQQRFLSPIHRNTQVQLIPFDEVNRIAQVDVLNRPRFPQSISFVGFKLPEYMLQKVRKFINELTAIRNKTLITSGIHSRISLNALLSGTSKPTTIKAIQAVRPTMVKNHFIQFCFLFVAVLMLLIPIPIPIPISEISVDKYIIIIISNFIDAGKFTTDHCVAG